MRRFAALALLMLFGCATPTVVLKNDDTGEIAQCGGRMSGSLIGGAYGYNLQKDSDDTCVKIHEAKGFKRVP